jgi:hypothetical protein
MLVKNTIKSVEFGTYGNCADLIPNEILDTKTIPNTNKIMVCVNYTYTDRNDTIALWGEYNIDSIDWNSFGLEKPEPIQVLHTYEVVKSDNTIAFKGQAYGINDFYKKFNIGLTSYLRIRCVG